MERGKCTANRAGVKKLLLGENMALDSAALALVCIGVSVSSLCNVQQLKPFSVVNLL